MGRRSKWDQSKSGEEGGSSKQQETKEEGRGREKDKKDKEPPKKTRWSNHASKTFVPGVPTFVPNCISKQELEALLLRIRIEEIGYKIATNQVEGEHEHRSRSPSPQPVYDQLGRRVNTKDQRIKQKLEQERSYLIERATKIHPSFKPPPDFKSGVGRRTKKIYIPVDQFPDYNFVGLIIGPRGLTQKQLEKETGAKIVIRGKGSAKNGRVNEDDNDDLHVLISGDTPSQINAAARAVKKLLVPVEESKNTHKIQQLRKLAEINGTLHENHFATRTWKSADVYCKHCGELSHPTADCPLKDKPVDKQAIEQDYEKFMNEIGMDLSQANPGSVEVEQSYEQFMNSLKTSSSAPTQMPSNPNPPPPPPSSAPTPWSQSGGPPFPPPHPPAGGGYPVMGAPPPPFAPFGRPGYPPMGRFPPGNNPLFGAPPPPMMPHGHMPPPPYGNPGYMPPPGHYPGHHTQ
jgi:splicing factor 1